MSTASLVACLPFQKLGMGPGFPKRVARTRSAQGRPLRSRFSERRHERCMFGGHPAPQQAVAEKKLLSSVARKRGSAGPRGSLGGWGGEGGYQLFEPDAMAPAARAAGRRFGPGPARGPEFRSTLPRQPSGAGRNENHSIPKRGRGELKDGVGRAARPTSKIGARRRGTDEFAGAYRENRRPKSKSEAALQKATGLDFNRYFMARGPSGRGLGAARRSSRPVARIACRDHPGHLARELRKNFYPPKLFFRGVGAPSGSVGGWLEGRGEPTFRARRDGAGGYRRRPAVRARPGSRAGTRPHPQLLNRRSDRGETRSAAKSLVAGR